MNAALMDVWRNAAAEGAALTTPLISIAVPFHNYDVTPLARELLAQAQIDAPGFELLFADDGSPGAQYSEALRQVFADSSVAARVLRSSVNIGRSAIRNRLVSAARGSYILLIDSDMLPDDSDYLARYLALAREGRAEVTCGGRSYRRVRAIRADQRLYHAFSARTECLPASLRQQRPAHYVMTNNLLVRRSLLAELPFAEDYRGWGYEDTDWGMRIAAQGIAHIDNSASHFGLISDRQLLAKLDESAANFVRLAARQPAFHAVPAYRHARRASRIPTGWLRRVCRTLALSAGLPLRWRQLAVQGYRLAIYAAALRSARESSRQ